MAAVLLVVLLVLLRRHRHWAGEPTLFVRVLGTCFMGVLV